MAAPDASEDLDLSFLLDLETHYHTLGYTQGYKDGLHQSRYESRIFGLEQGFAKAVIMGRMHARARMWEARMRQTTRALEEQPWQVQKEGKDEEEEEVVKEEEEEEEGEETAQQQQRLPLLKPNDRLTRTITNLLLYTDPSTLLGSNTDDEVADYDFRLRKAGDLVKIVERMVGERDLGGEGGGGGGVVGGEIEEVRVRIAES